MLIIPAKKDATNEDDMLYLVPFNALFSGVGGRIILYTSTGLDFIFFLLFFFHFCFVGVFHSLLILFTHLFCFYLLFLFPDFPLFSCLALLLIVYFWVVRTRTRAA